MIRLVNPRILLQYSEICRFDIALFSTIHRENCTKQENLKENLLSCLRKLLRSIVLTGARRKGT